MTTILLHEILCVLALYGAFCRLVQVNHQTLVSIRFAFFLIGFAACAGIAQPLQAGWAPTVFELSLLLAVVTMQLVTAHRWRDGVPEKFQLQKEAP